MKLLLLNRLINYAVLSAHKSELEDSMGIVSKTVMTTNSSIDNLIIIMLSIVYESTHDVS